MLCPSPPRLSSTCGCDRTFSDSEISKCRTAHRCTGDGRPLVAFGRGVVCIKRRDNHGSLIGFKGLGGAPESGRLAGKWKSVSGKARRHPVVWGLDIQTRMVCHAVTTMGSMAQWPPEKSDSGPGLIGKSLTLVERRRIELPTFAWRMRKPSFTDQPLTRNPLFLHSLY